MRSPYAHRLVGVLLGVVAACSHRNATGDARAEGVAPAAAPTGSVMTEEEIAHSSGRPIDPRGICETK